MKFVRVSLLLLLIVICVLAFTDSKPTDDLYLTYRVNPKKQELKLYWKDDKGQPFKSIGQLKKWIEGNHQTLLFATNAGMYKTDNSALGLFIQDQKIIAPLNTRSASGNFYWKPNGILYIDTDNNASICKTENYVQRKNIKYATQSGPMLVYDGKIHPEFKQGSTNLNIRNGVGLLPNNELVFIMSKKEVNLYDFAAYFKTLGCKDALSFDGFVCRTYLPEQNWIQTDGNFGVMVGVTSKK